MVVDPESPDAAYLEAAVRLARLLAIATLEEREVDVDAAAIGRALAGVREQLEAIRALKTQLTSVSNATKAVWTGLETMRTGILARVAEAEAELRVAQAATAALGDGAARLALPAATRSHGATRPRGLMVPVTTGPWCGAVHSGEAGGGCREEDTGVTLRRSWSAMPRVASAALALLAAIRRCRRSPRCSRRLAAARAAPEDAGAVEPSAKADPTGRCIVVYKDDADTKAANGPGTRPRHRDGSQVQEGLKGYAAKLTRRQLAAGQGRPGGRVRRPRTGSIRAQDQTSRRRPPRGRTRNTTAQIDGVDERVNADVAIFDTGIDRSHPDLNVVGGYNCSLVEPRPPGATATATAPTSRGRSAPWTTASASWAWPRACGCGRSASSARTAAGLISWYVCGMDWIAAQRDPIDPTRPLIEAVNMSVAKPGSDDHNCG